MTTTSTRPRVKHTSPVFRQGSKVYVGGFGNVTEIDDESGSVGALLELLDGRRTIPEVQAALAEAYPDITLADVEAAIGQLDGAGFVEDAAAGWSVLDDYERKRWERNINFFGSYVHLGENKYELQRRLLDCRLTLLGLGGLGSHVLLDAAAMGIGHVRIVEFDTVELSNLNRQILYTDADIGRPKIEVAAERVRAFNPRIDVEPMPGKITGTSDVMRAVADADVVISVADRPKMQIIQWINEGCVRSRVPLITGGLETQRAIYYTIIPGQTGCVECWRLKIAESDPVSTALLDERRARGLGGDNAAFCPLVTMTTGLLLGELVRLVTGIAPPIALGRLLELRFDDYHFSEAERWERHPDCSVCGALAGDERLPELAGAATAKAR
jgi:molybdopterin/thiamine biosynthesis adenylyltransferase